MVTQRILQSSLYFWVKLSVLVLVEMMKSPSFSDRRHHF